MLLESGTTRFIEPSSPVKEKKIEKKEETPNDVLFKKGKLLGVLSLNGLSKPNGTLQRAAENQAKYQASIRVQGHFGWNERYQQLRKELPGFHFVEIVNESWPGQDVNAAAAEMYRSWKYSSGHWSVIDGECKIYGLAMERGKNGTWYACEIVGR